MFRVILYLMLLRLKLLASCTVMNAIGFVRSENNWNWK